MFTEEFKTSLGWLSVTRIDRKIQEVLRRQLNGTATLEDETLIEELTGIRRDVLLPGVLRERMGRHLERRLRPVSL